MVKIYKNGASVDFDTVVWHDGKNAYQVCVDAGAGGAVWSFYVRANSADDACDSICDFCDEESIISLTAEDILRNYGDNTSDSDVDNLAYANGYVCCGNSGHYIPVISVAEISLDEYTTVCTKVLRVINDNVPGEGIVYDADTVLADIVEEADMHVPGLATDLMNMYTNTADKSMFRELFYLLTDCEYDEYLERAVRVIRSNGDI